MNLPRHRLVAFGVAGLILLGGMLFFAFPATDTGEGGGEAASEAVDEANSDEPGTSDASGEEGPEPAVPETADYGGMLLKMVLAVAVVCALAYAILRWGLRRVVGEQKGSEQMEVLARLGVGPDRAILVVRVGPRHLVIGSAETGISILTELSEEEARAFSDPQTPET